MIKGKLIVIEGTDGCGKQTQTDYLYKNLINLGLKVAKISFPNYNSPACEPVKMYLNGEFGKNEDVNIFASSSFFAIDRYASFKSDWEKLYNEGYIIIADRYTISNIIHQANRIDDENKFMEYNNWLIDLEWNKFALPKPDLMILLDMPYEFSNKILKNRKNKIDGSSTKDILEADEEQKKRAYTVAIKIAKLYDMKIVNCIAASSLRSIDDIQKDIMKFVKEEILV
ncbi:dTMP kinase [Sneathia sanguinegens]|uniref:dTMP kinase n=1 Tax=Sneathia sanguinegens TaxID=40543 RepID=UPI0023F91BF5|nr:thymidylate kinase [Sneathia sanguinegens]